LNDKVLEFIAYSNVNVEKVKENSPRSAQKSGLIVGSLAEQTSKPESDFVKQMKAKQAS
jgi:hypothetical protein